MPVPRDFAGSIDSIAQYHAFDKGEREWYESPHNKIRIFRSVNTADPNNAQVVETRANLAKLVEQCDRDGGFNAHGFRDLMDTRKSLGETDFSPKVRAADKYFRERCDEIDLIAMGNALYSEDGPTRRTGRSGNTDATGSSYQGFAHTLYQTVTDTLSGTGRIINDNVNWLLFRPRTDNPDDLEGGPPGTDQSR